MKFRRYWSAAVTRFSEESRAAHHVERQGFGYYLPVVEERSAGRWRRTLMFPGYILVEINEDWRYLSSTRGIARLMLCDDAPAKIRSGVVEELRSREDSRGIVQLRSRLRGGESVRTSSGLVGIVKETLADDRCRVLTSLMGRSVEGVFEDRELALV